MIVRIYFTSFKLNATKQRPLQGNGMAAISKIKELNCKGMLVFNYIGKGNFNTHIRVGWRGSYFLQSFTLLVEVTALKVKNFHNATAVGYGRRLLTCSYGFTHW